MTERQSGIKFCQKLGNSQVETIRKIQRAFSDDDMGVTQIKARQVRSNVKVMLTAFFDSCSVVHLEYTPQGQKFTKEYYRDVFHCLHEAV